MTRYGPLGAPESASVCPKSDSCPSVREVFATSRKPATPTVVVEHEPDGRDAASRGSSWRRRPPGDGASRVKSARRTPRRAGAGMTTGTRVSSGLMKKRSTWRLNAKVARLTPSTRVGQPGLVFDHGLVVERFRARRPETTPRRSADGRHRDAIPGAGPPQRWESCARGATIPDRAGPIQRARALCELGEHPRDRRRPRVREREVPAAEPPPPRDARRATVEHEARWRIRATHHLDVRGSRRQVSSRWQPPSSRLLRAKARGIAFDSASPARVASTHAPAA